MKRATQDLHLQAQAEAARYRRDIDALAENAAIDIAVVETEAIAGFRGAIALGNAVSTQA